MEKKEKITIIKTYVKIWLNQLSNNNQQATIEK